MAIKKIQIILFCLLTAILPVVLLAACSPAPVITDEPATAVPPTAAPTKPAPPPKELLTWLDPDYDFQYRAGEALTIYFNQPMDPASAAEPLVFIPAWGGEYAWQNNFRTLVFTPTLPAKNSTQTIEVSMNLASQAGQTLVKPPRWKLVTGDKPWVNSSPAYGGLSEANPIIEFTFSQEMDRASVAAALTVTPTLPMTLTWKTTDGGKTERKLLLQLGGQLIPGTKIIVTLAGSAVSIHGRPVQRTQWEHHTPAFKAQFRRPSTGSRLEPFEIVFNYELDGESLIRAFSTRPQLGLTPEWDARKKTLRLTPGRALLAGETWQFNLNPAFTLPDGTPVVDKALTWAYSVPPTILAASGITPEIRHFTLVSSVALDPQIFAEALRIAPAFDYDLTWTPAYTQVSIIPRQNLPGLMEYTLSFAGELKDRDGLTLKENGRYSLTTPSPLLNWFASEENWNPYIKTEKSLLVVFDRPMQPTATLAALNLSPAVPGAWQWVSPTQLKRVPESGVVPGCTSYQLTVGSGALDANGDPLLTSSQSWHATTYPLPSLASFGDEGARVQVLDSSGRRTIQMRADGKLKSVHLDFYRISLETLVASHPNQYATDYGYDCNRTIFDTSQGSLQAAYDAPLRRASDGAEVALPPDLPPGIYITNLVTDYLDDQLLLVVTPHTLALKYAPRPGGGGQFSAWVSNINGPLLRGALIQVYDASGVRLASGESDANGLFQTELPAGSAPYLAAAWWDGKLTVSGVGGVWGEAVRPTDRYQAFLYTDRPLYRPGQIVHYKGVVRLDEDAAYRLPAETFTATLNLRSPRGSLLGAYPVRLTGFGTFSGTLDIAAGATLGDYTLELAIGAETHTQTFQVQEYQKPDLQVQVSTEKSAYMAGESFTVQVDTRYLFGQPAVNASLKVVQYTFSPYFYYGEYWEQSYNPKHRLTLTSDENGLASFTVLVQREDLIYGPYRTQAWPWVVEVTADDGSGQTVSGFARVAIYPSALQPKLTTGGFVFPAGAPLPVVASVSSELGASVAGQKLSLAVAKWQRSSGWDGDYKDLQTHALTSDDAGQARITLDLQAGSYRLKLTSTDHLGNKQETDRYIYVDDANGTWYADWTTEINLSVDQQEYRAGSTAQVLVQSTFSGEALLTIERGRVLEQRMVRLTAPFTTLTIPIKAEYAPNVYVVVQAWRPQDTDIAKAKDFYETIPDARLRSDSIQLVVPDRAHALTVSITPDQASYAPGQTAEFALQVTDANGKPVQAEVSLALVDEAIFLLADDPAGDIHAYLYRPRTAGVADSNSMAPSRSLYAGGMGGGGDYNPSEPRADFPDTVLWLPAVVTDAGGHARLALTLPDSLTTWRLTARAVTLQTQVGQAESKIITQQPLVLRPLLPLSLTAGDSFQLAAMVHNYSDQTLDLTVSARVSGVELAAPADQILRLAPGGSGQAAWDARAVDNGPATVIFSAAAADYSDAVQLSLPVQPLAIPAGGVQTGQFQGETRLSLTPPESALPGSQVRLTLNASLAGSLLQGAEYLTGFPYGCVEQTMSRALPNAVIARAFKEFGAGDRLALSQLDGKIAASIQRLYALQHIDGGWGWWFDDPSNAYQTAWVVFGLAVTRESGYLVDAEVIKQGAEYLQENLAEQNAPTRAFAVYALARAGHATLEQARAQLPALNDLDQFSRAALALAFHQLGDAQNARSLVDGLRGGLLSAANGGLQASGADRDGMYASKFMSSALRSSAMILWALNTIEPEAGEIDGLARWLQGQRGAHGWGTTNETAYAILALTDYWAARQDQLGAVPVEVTLNSRLLSTATLDAGQLKLETDIPLAALSAGKNELVLRSGSRGLIYFVLDSQMLLGQSAIAAAGIGLQREYLDPLGKTPVSEIHSGDLVLVRLTVNSKTSLDYVLLEDHLPGGLQAVNERLNTTAHDEAMWPFHDGWGDPDPFYYDDYGYNQKEIHPDRVSFFITELGAGQHVFEYFVRAITPGVFTALPAQISAMYDKEQTGRSSSQVLTVLGRR